MNVAKHSGRNNYRLFKQEMNAHALESRFVGPVQRGPAEIHALGGIPVALGDAGPEATTRSSSR
jgi:hypothetical protein